jgi:hypothetical protein
MARRRSWAATAAVAALWLVAGLWMLCLTGSSCAVLPSPSLLHSNAPARRLLAGASNGRRLKQHFARASPQQQQVPQRQLGRTTERHPGMHT